MKSLSLMVLVILSFCSLGQLGDPVIGPEYNTEKKENFSGFLGENHIALFTADYAYHSRKKQDLIIRQFHKTDLQLTDSKNIFHEIQEGYTNEPEEIYYQNERFFLFSKLFSERDKTQLLALEVFYINCERLSVLILDTLATDEVHYIEASNDQNGFVLAKHAKFNQLLEQEISLLKLDRTGQIEWTQNIKSPMALQSLRVEQIRFGDNTPIYILCNYAFNLSDPDSENAPPIDNQYALWAYDPRNEFLKEFEIRFKEKWVNGISVQLSRSNQLMVGGYFNETKNPAISGVFTMKVGPKLKVMHTSWWPFDAGLFEKFIKQESSKKRPELADYQLKNMLFLNNGSFFIVGEQYYKYIERTYDSRSNITTTTENYNYNSIIVSYFDSLGTHKWSDRVSKSQNSTNDYGYFSSFVPMNSGKEIYLIFNDAQRNNEEPPQGYYSYANLFNNRKPQISYVRIGTKGIVTRGGLLSADFDHMLRAKLSGQLTDDAIYLITESNRDSRIVKVSVKQ